MTETMITRVRPAFGRLAAALLGATVLAGPAGMRPAAAQGVTGRDLTRSLLGNPPRSPGAPAPNAVTDLGPLSQSAVLTITVYLKPGDQAGLAAFVAAVQTPGDPSFHQFLSQADFITRFAPTAATLSLVESTLQTAGFTIDSQTGVFANHLAIRATGTVAVIDATFGLNLHSVTSGGNGGYASTTQPVFPATIAPYLRGVGGFETIIPSSPGPVEGATYSDDPLLLSNVTLDPALAKSSGVSDAPQSLTPADYEKLYDVEPLVQAGATGAGETIAIVTEENFDPSDATAFWSKVGVTVGPNHLQLQYVDGAASGPVPAGSKTSESDVDTEQSGAIAPNASVIAYVTPSGPASLLDGYEQVASDNKADVVSSSFGTPELYFQPSGAEIYNVTLLPAFNDVFSEMAAQGQTLFVAAGDAGAFGVNRNENGYYWVYPGGTGAPAYTPVYSVNGIAANPLVTAAGGTTLPISGTDTAATPNFTVKIAHEQPWSLSYLLVSQLAETQDFAETQTLFKLAFPEAGAGGVSSLWPVPAYQQGLAGVQKTLPGQALVQLGGTPHVLATEPSGFAGRNIPDLCANADTNSGYLRVVQGQMLPDGSGTSIVAPQFAGTLALIDQMLGHRTGQLNPLLYRLQASGAAPARDITAAPSTGSGIVTGDNWGYVAHPGFDQASGLGAMDGLKLYNGLKSFD